MIDFIKTYAITFVVFMVVEGLWLVLVAKNLYDRDLGFIMNDVPKIIPVILFSLIFVGGLVVFVINPALIKKSLKFTILMGAFYGFASYATYDLTNLSLLKGWALNVTIIDLIWGSVMGSFVATISYYILQYFA